MEEIKQFWNRKHGNNNLKALSGCTLEQANEVLQIQEMLKPGLKVLEVGCGLGYITKSLSELGEVSVVDIAENALDRVRPLCKNVYRSTETDQLPANYFDLIICHNVIQHVPTVDLKREFEDFAKALKKDGVLAIQFVECAPEDDCGEDYGYESSRLGFLGRSVSFMQNLFVAWGCNTRVISSKEVAHPPITATHTMHVTKR